MQAEKLAATRARKRCRWATTPSGTTAIAAIGPRCGRNHPMTTKATLTPASTGRGGKLDRP